MTSIIKRKSIITHHETELINISDEIRAEIESASIESGIVFIMSMHTTTALTVNEGLPDIESDIVNSLHKLIPDDLNYRHARFLHKDGQMAINAPAHIRGSLIGFECFFPIEHGQFVCGNRQNIYFVELDGPQERKYIIQILGE